MEPGKLLKKVGKGVGAVASTIVDVAGGAAEAAGNVVDKGRSVVPGIGSAQQKRTRKSTKAKKPASAAKTSGKASGARASAPKATATRRTKASGATQASPRKKSTQDSSG